MKKKSFLSGFNAKFVLAAVALSSALLTGCYKDDGLDVNSPSGTVTLPAASYTLTATVVNAEGGLVENASVTVDNAPVTLANGSFSKAVKPGKVVIKASCEGYNTVEKTVEVIEIPDGQAAVYTEVIVLTKDATPEVAATYDLGVVAFAASDLTNELKKEEYTVKVTDGAGAEVTSLTGLAAGRYNVVVTPKDTEKYNAYTTAIDLARVMGTAAETIKVQVYAVLTEKAADKEYVVLNGMANLSSEYTLTNLQITRNDVVVAESEADYIVYLAEKDGAAYQFKVNYTDADGNKLTIIRDYTDTVLTFFVSINAEAPTATVPVTPGTYPLVGDDALTIAEGTTAKIGDVEYSSFDLARLLDVETTPAVARAFMGTPDGLVFSNPIKISFKDTWNNELGDLELQYLGTNGWAKDTEGGSVTLAGDTYVMNVKHFSSFRAEVPVSSSFADKRDTVSTDETFDKKNDTDRTVKVKYRYGYQTGMSISDVEQAVSAKFESQAAISYVTNIISEDLAVKGYVNMGIETNYDIKEFTVLPYTVLNKVTTKQGMNVITATYTINDKDIVITITKPEGVRVVPDTYTYGHGHGHAHGHGGDLNAGGGIIEVE